MKNLIVGIDPGKQGGIVFITERGFFHAGYYMPLNSAKEIDIRQIVFIFDQYSVNHVFIEKVTYPPFQNVKATCTTCTGFGKILSVLEIMELKYQEIHPSTWKKYFKLVKKPKSESVSMARKLFPKAPSNLFMGSKGGMKDGPAEALLIAEYGRRLIK